MARAVSRPCRLSFVPIMMMMNDGDDDDVDEEHSSSQVSIKPTPCHPPPKEISTKTTEPPTPLSLSAQNPQSPAQITMSSSSPSPSLIRLTILITKLDTVSTVDFHTYWSVSHPKIWLSVQIVKDKVVKYSQVQCFRPFVPTSRQAN